MTIALNDDYMSIRVTKSEADVRPIIAQARLSVQFAVTVWRRWAGLPAKLLPHLIQVNWVLENRHDGNWRVLTVRNLSNVKAARPVANH